VSAPEAPGAQDFPPVTLPDPPSPAWDGEWVAFLMGVLGPDEDTLRALADLIRDAAQWALFVEKLYSRPTKYRPIHVLSMFIRLRDKHCTYPGCTVKAKHCDIDHMDPFNHKNPRKGGLTVPENLHCVCRTHHLLKTRKLLRAHRDRATGAVVWTTRHNRRYIGKPQPHLRT